MKTDTTLSRERIIEIRQVALDCLKSQDFAQVCDMALKYLDEVVDAPPANEKDIPW